MNRRDFASADRRNTIARWNGCPALLWGRDEIARARTSREAVMRGMNLVGIGAIVAFGLLSGCATPPAGKPATAYEGARLIAGDGRVIENATLVVEGEKIAQ